MLNNEQALLIAVAIFAWHHSMHMQMIYVKKINYKKDMKTSSTCSNFLIQWKDLVKIMYLLY